MSQRHQIRYKHYSILRQTTKNQCYGAGVNQLKSHINAGNVWENKAMLNCDCSVVIWFTWHLWMLFSMHAVNGWKIFITPKMERKSSFCQPWHLGIELSNRLGSPLSCYNHSVEQLIINNLQSFSEVANSIWYIQVRHIFLKVFIFVRASRRGTVVACVRLSVRPSIHLVRTITSHRFVL